MECNFNSVHTIMQLLLIQRVYQVIVGYCSCSNSKSYITFSVPMLCYILPSGVYGHRSAAGDIICFISGLQESHTSSTRLYTQ